VRRLRDVGEHAWIGRWITRLARWPGAASGGRVVVGPGDDAAAVRPGPHTLLLTTDALIEDVHFHRSWVTPAALGRRAFAVNASDLAAMGAVPRFALLALEAPPATPLATIDALARGFARAATRVGARLVGGNLAAGPHLALTATLVGEAPGRIVTRRGAQPGDLLYVTGAFGACGLAVRRLAEGRAGRLPEIPRRTPAGVLLARVASAMIDVSDGLLQDLGHVCRASGAAAEVELDRVPVAPACRQALGLGAGAFAAQAGEDYELLVAIPRRREAALLRLRRHLGCPITRIGRIVAGRPAVRVREQVGRPPHSARGGFDHFRR